MYSEESTPDTHGGYEHPHQRVGESAQQPLADLPAESIVSYVDAHAQYPGAPVKLRNEIKGATGSLVGVPAIGCLFLCLHQGRDPWLVYSFCPQPLTPPEHLASLLAVEDLDYHYLTPINGRDHTSMVRFTFDKRAMKAIAEVVGSPEGKGGWLFHLLTPGKWHSVVRTPINGPKHLWIALFGDRNEP